MARQDDINRLVLYQMVNVTISADGYAYIEGPKGAWKELLVSVTNAEDEPDLGHPGIDWFGEDT